MKGNAYAAGHGAQKDARASGMIYLDTFDNQYRDLYQVHSTAHPVGAAAFVQPSGTSHEVEVAAAAQSKLVVGGVVVHAQG